MTAENNIETSDPAEQRLALAPPSPVAAPAPALAPSVDTSGDDANRIATIEARVDTVCQLVASSKKVWYREASTLVAVLALAFSFGTTFVSYYRTAQLDRHAAQVELRSLMQRIAVLPREQFEILQEFKDDAAAIQSMTSFLNNENLVLTRQASAILNRIPDLATGAEYYAIGVGLYNSGLVEESLEKIRIAGERSTSAPTAIAAHRSLGHYAYLNGQFETGRRAWEDALAVYEKRFPETPEFLQDQTNALTLAMWANVEASVGRCDAAGKHLDDARVQIESTPQIALAPILPTLTQTESLVAGCTEGRPATALNSQGGITP